MQSRSSIPVGNAPAKRACPVGDLELLAEVAGQVGLLISLSNLTAGRANQIRQLVAESQAQANELNLIAAEMLTAISTNSDSEFIRVVAEGLRHLSDYITVGQVLS